MFDVFFVFFQAEDGIRDLVRSRGLGDVYKRQDAVDTDLDHHEEIPRARIEQMPGSREVLFGHLVAVSYTHLTLPTSDLV